MKNIKVKAHANIALIKYWGKRDRELVLPTKSSLSITLSGLNTITKISFNKNNCDNIILNDSPVSGDTHVRIINFLSQARKYYNISGFFDINTKNNFPTAAGLASSASGYAALAVGINELCDLKLSQREVSMLARLGSGSAARSVFGGFVAWYKGKCSIGSDSYAEKIFSHTHWPELRVIAAIVETGKKAVSSRDGMEFSRATSPYYDRWILRSEERFNKIIGAIADKDLKLMGSLSQQDCLDMHEVIHTTSPTLDYWNDSTRKILHIVQSLQDMGVMCFLTIDAGPNVKVMCLAPDLEQVYHALTMCPGVRDLIICHVADDPTIL
jgi:diphosphomevalonate decarboxylase